MKQLCLARAATGSTTNTGDAVLIDVPTGSNTAVMLSLDSNGALVATECDSQQLLGSTASQLVSPLGVLHPLGEADRCEWYFVAVSANVGVNCISPPLPLMRLEPGSLLSSGQQFWMATWKWTPTPVDVPPELADKPCPICGGELGLAPAVECPCGRWTHFERPDKPDDDEALNCYFESRTCSDCERRVSLEPQLVPELPEKLADVLATDDWDL